MSSFFTEDIFEQAVIALFRIWGYSLDMPQADYENIIL